MTRRRRDRRVLRHRFLAYSRHHRRPWSKIVGEGGGDSRLGSTKNGVARDIN